MADIDRPQLYLVTPPAISLTDFPDRLARVLDGAEVACLRLALASFDEAELGRAADAIRAVAHARDVALVIDRHFLLAARHGLDGVHLLDGPRNVRKARAELGDDAIVGAFCGSSRHDGLSAGEAGADYVSFGPVGPSPLGDGTQAEDDLFAWWSEVIEVPVVAEGALSVDRVRALAPITDFFAVGEEIWREDDALEALRTLMAPLG